MIHELGGRLQLLSWWFQTTEEGEEDLLDTRLQALVARGHADRSMDTAIDAEWLDGMIWTTLFAASRFVDTGHRTLRDARATATHLLIKMVRS